MPLPPQYWDQRCAPPHTPTSSRLTFCRCFYVLTTCCSPPPPNLCFAYSSGAPVGDLLSPGVEQALNNSSSAEWWSLQILTKASVSNVLPKSTQNTERQPRDTGPGESKVCVEGKHLFLKIHLYGGFRDGSAVKSTCRSPREPRFSS